MAKVPANPDTENTGQKKVTRREFLNVAWLASLGFMTLSIGGMTYFFSIPRFQEGEFGGRFPAGSASELPSVEAAPGNFPSGKFWLSNTPTGVLALFKVCTHLGCLYGWNEQENKFKCPCHGSEFEKDGTFIQGPAPRSLDRFIVQAVDPDTGDILAESPEDGSPMPIPDNPNALIVVDTGNRIRGEPK
jgi:cytochrome b6-f complex iron-sulfur subunit